MKQRQKNNKSSSLTFVDAFSGCGGISLGLANAGWNGSFVIEKNPSAFKTLKTNLIDGKRSCFNWPSWFPKEPISASGFLKNYKHNLNELKGEIALFVGGPPCQGFSLAGRRTQTDPRNLLIKNYIEIVQKLEPRILFIENVQGFTMPFMETSSGAKKSIPYSKKVIRQLEKIGYKVFSELVDLSSYGVPQTRKRFIIIAIRESDPAYDKLNGKTPFDLLAANRKNFLSKKRLPISRPVSVREAIGDLEVSGKKLIRSIDSPSNKHKQIEYKKLDVEPSFIKLMRNSTKTPIDSMRLPNHKVETVRKFRKIISTCVPGRTLNKVDRMRLGIKKQAVTPLHRDLPAKTITTLPDDVIHYSEPRILTLRESARIQTFPDWFKFTGNYTTGGKARRNECPRYTQVGNAVPPLFSEAVGTVLKSLAS